MTAEQARRRRHEKALARIDEENASTFSSHPEDDDERQERPRRKPRSSSDAVPLLLGFVGIGMSLAQIIAPKAFARAIGVKPNRRARSIVRAMGVRDLAAGAGMLWQPKRPEWAWAKVAGAAMDVSLLAAATTKRRSNVPRIRSAAMATLVLAALDVLVARRMTRAADDQADEDEGINVQRSITINCAVDQVYSFWRDFGNLPRFMAHLEGVEVLDDTRSHWTAKGPAGSSVSWDAEIIEDVPNERIAWESGDDADVVNSGVVRFMAAPGDRGTEVHVDLQYQPPAGRLGALVAKLFGEEPEMQIADDLRHLKQVLETGEVVRSDASVRTGIHNPAQPTGATEGSTEQ